jgi:hypothetical protein
VDAIEKKFFSSVGNQTPAVESVTRRYTDRAIPTEERGSDGRLEKTAY